ncbi:hypothetical protein J6590_077486 [Homalodisca vitripennis]|nr:hypothetical protein J6590_077486 [Homalodisca vitripennis]
MLSSTPLSIINNQALAIEHDRNPTLIKGLYQIVWLTLKTHPFNPLATSFPRAEGAYAHTLTSAVMVKVTASSTFYLRIPAEKKSLRNSVHKQ